MAAKPPPMPVAPLLPICLDLTRLARRVGHGPPTGIDRVDQAYFTEFLGSEAELFGLIRTKLGFLLLDRGGMEAACDALLVSVGDPEGMNEGHAAKRRAVRKKVLRLLRSLAIARTPRWGVARMICQHLPANLRYLNLGHANLERSIVGAVRSLSGGRAIAMIHDTIPLDRPDTIVPKSAVGFRRTMGAALACDLLLANSDQTRADILRFGGKRTPPVEVLALGMTSRLRRTNDEPDPADPSIFVMLGTIEPRKNHALMLAVWQHFHDTRPPDDIPHLVIVGGRGWENKDVFETLDNAPFMGRTVHEAGRLDDTELSGILSRATALLFPSLAEGYGLPPMEAAAIGLPVISADLAPVRAILGDYPVYVDTGDMQQWTNAIDHMVATGRSSAWKQPPPLPTWESHFRQLRALL